MQANLNIIILSFTELVGRIKKNSSRYKRLNQNIKPNICSLSNSTTKNVLEIFAIMDLKKVATIISISTSKEISCIKQ